MVRVRLTKDHVIHSREERERQAANRHPGATATYRGLTERQWFITLLVIGGLLLLFTFRGCILPTGVGPKNKFAVTTPTPSAQVSAQPAGSEYTVVAGDTLSKIAQKNGVTLDALIAANNIDRRNVVLRVGQKLVIPAAAPTP